MHPLIPRVKSKSGAYAIVICVVLGFGLADTKGGPLDFFRRLGNSIAHPHHDQPPRRSPRHGNSAKPKANASASPAADENAAAEEQPVAAVTPSPASTPAPVKTETPKVIPNLPATSVPPAQVGRADLPYGVPVPNKPGFVVSPYSPGGGYVDIRGFPNGTPVKDPYTGKIFLTP